LLLIKKWQKTMGLNMMSQARRTRTSSFLSLTPSKAKEKTKWMRLSVFKDNQWSILLQLFMSRKEAAAQRRHEEFMMLALSNNPESLSLYMQHIERKSRESDKA
jgi:hypothetical protein